MNRLSILPSIFLLLSASCSNQEPSPEQPTFTQERPGFTTDRSDTGTSDIFFTDITQEAGLDFIHENGAFGKKWMPETIGSGGGFLDYNNDGWIDIFLVNSAEWPRDELASQKSTPKLYRNRGDATFEDVTDRAGLNFSIYGMGVTFADYDADGDTDIYMTAVGDNKLLQNNNGLFTDVTSQMQVSGNSNIPGEAPAWSTSTAWVDVDRDGWLDLFVANYVKWTPETDIYTTRDGKTKSYATPDVYQGETCRLYRNMNGQYFEDITDQAGIRNDDGKSLGVAIADFNNDFWPDIVVSNDTQPNFLYINNGDPDRSGQVRFTDQAIQAGVGYDEVGRARAGMGIDVADVQNSDRLAIAIGNFSQEPLSLYTQVGDGSLFQDRAGAARLTRTSLQMLTFGLQFVDLDLDGFVDLVAANGHIEPEINIVQQEITFKQKPQVFYNQNGQFQDISSQAGDPFNEPVVARGIASADIDKDGDLDLLFTINGASAKLLRNETVSSKTNWIRIQLQGLAPNLQAVGAQVAIWSEGMVQKRMVRTGSSYLSQSDINKIIFGLGDAPKADSILVRWPTTGKFSKLSDVQSGKTNLIREQNTE